MAAAIDQPSSCASEPPRSCSTLASTTSAAVPATNGAAKLVPLIGVLVAGVVVCLIAFVSQGLTTAIVVAIALVLIVVLG